MELSETQIGLLLPQDLQWLLFEFKIKSTILNMAYKVSPNLGLHVQFLSPLPLSQCIAPLVAVVHVLQLLRDAVPFFSTSRLLYKLLCFPGEFSSFKSRPSIGISQKVSLTLASTRSGSLCPFLPLDYLSGGRSHQIPSIEYRI